MYTENDKRNSDRGALSCTAKWLVLYFSAESEVGTAPASCFADTDIGESRKWRTQQVLKRQEEEKSSSFFCCRGRALVFFTRYAVYKIQNNEKISYSNLQKSGEIA